MMRFFTWCEGVKETTLAGHILMNLKGLIPLAGLVVAAVEGGGQWKAPLLITAGVALSVPPMFAVGRKYDGFVKAMGLPQLMLTAPATYTVVKAVLVDKTVTLDSQPLSFVWSHALLVVFGISSAFDVWDTFEWHVLRTRKVLRCAQHLREWKRRGKLKPSTGNVQWLMRRGVKVDPDCDDYGFLKE